MTPKDPSPSLSPKAGPCTYDDSFGALVHFVRLGLIRHLESELAASGLGVTFSQYRVLKLLAAEDSIKSSELARRLDHDPGALTRILDRFQEQGYVLRQPRQDDRRAVDVVLTEAGRKFFAPMRQLAVGLNEHALQELSPEEQQTLKSLL